MESTEQPHHIDEVTIDGCDFAIKCKIAGVAGLLTIHATSVKSLVFIAGRLARQSAIEVIEPPLEWSYTPEGAPICAKHGEVMRKREKQGAEWYAHNASGDSDNDRGWCRGYRGRLSPGYDLP